MKMSLWPRKTQGNPDTADLSGNSPEADTVSENPDWKQKYRDSVLEMEAEETKWRQIEAVLRRLIGRLCAAGIGVDPQLDDELIALAAANRRNADAQELERMAATLTSAVVAVDTVFTASVTQDAAPTVDALTRTALAALLEKLRGDAADSPIADGLITALAKAVDDAELADIVTGAADLVHARGESAAQARLQAAAIIAEVSERLEEVSGYLVETNDANRTRFDDAQSHNDTVISQVRELTAEVSSATELSVLQSLLAQRLEKVTQQVSNFRAREEDRVLEYDARAEQMRARITLLERETQDLHSKLDSEKNGARIDPLTGVANRKSFEERFAHELARRADNEVPVVMLLWDIDSFKLINDSYGHRAGDRVLQSVAAAFTAIVGQREFVARIGGEEFVVLLSGQNLAEAMQVANHLRTAVASLNFHFRGTPVRVTVSCGMTAVESHDSPETAFDRADAALYRAKHGGKNLCIAA